MKIAVSDSILNNKFEIFTSVNECMREICV